MRWTYMTALSLGASSLIEAGAQAQEPVYLPAGPTAPFSAAVQVGDVLYLSGQIGVRPDGTKPEDLEGQSRQTMDNIARFLETQDLTMDSVFKCTVFLQDMSRWAEFNAVYVTYFQPGRLPARSALGSNGLAGGALLEVECLAYNKAS